MSHTHRFFSDVVTADMSYVELSGEEAHHALRVARVRPGDGVSVFDGKGLEIIGECDRIDKRSVYIRAVRTTHHAPPPVRVTVAVGGLHRDKAQETVVRRAAEMGAWRVCFWHADHSQRPIKPTERWRKTAIEACKQCGRVYLPEVDTAPSLEAFLKQHNGPCIIGLLTKDAAAGAPTISMADNVALLIGPEGDFSEQERNAALNAGAQPVSLGSYTYRSEVAAALLMTIVACAIGDLGPGVALDMPRK